MSSEMTNLSTPLKVVESARTRGNTPRDYAFAPPSQSTPTPEPAPASVPPPQPAAAPPVADPAITPEQLNAAVAVLNQHFTAMRTDIKFSMVPDLGMLVVAVVDAHDGTVLMQIPSEQALQTAREVNRGQGEPNLLNTVA